MAEKATTTDRGSEFTRLVRNAKVVFRAKRDHLHRAHRHGVAAQQFAVHRADLAATGARRVFAVDAASSFSRPGPRLADGVELLSHLLHPGLIPAPPGLAWHELDVAGAVR